MRGGCDGQDGELKSRGIQAEGEQSVRLTRLRGGRRMLTCFVIYVCRGRRSRRPAGLSLTRRQKHASCIKLEREESGRSHHGKAKRRIGGTEPEGVVDQGSRSMAREEKRSVSDEWKEGIVTGGRGGLGGGERVWSLFPGSRYSTGESLLGFGRATMGRVRIQGVHAGPGRYKRPVHVLQATDTERRGQPRSRSEVPDTVSARTQIPACRGVVLSRASTSRRRL